MTDDELKQIRERLGKATPGPWERNCNSVFTKDNFLIWIGGESSRFEIGDAEFIAHARQDVGKLLDKVKLLSDELDRERLALHVSEHTVEILRNEKV